MFATLSNAVVAAVQDLYGAEVTTDTVQIQKTRS